MLRSLAMSVVALIVICAVIAILFAPMFPGTPGLDQLGAAAQYVNFTLTVDDDCQNDFAADMPNLRTPIEDACNFIFK